MAANQPVRRKARASDNSGRTSAVSRAAQENLLILKMRLSIWFASELGTVIGDSIHSQPPIAVTGERLLSGVVPTGLSYSARKSRTCWLGERAMADEPIATQSAGRRRWTRYLQY
jgi:hypothetical protein